MALKTRHPGGALLRYIEGALADTEKQEIDEHLRECSECREQLAFTKNIKQRLGELSEQEFTTNEACPDSWTLVSYEAGEVDEETARHLRAHLLFCDDCMNEFYSLRKLRGPNWTRVAIKAGEKMLGVLGLSGFGTLLEPTLAGDITRDVPEAGSSQVDVGGEVVDPDSAETSLVRVSFKSGPDYMGALLRFEADPPRPNWQVRLLTEDGNELASLPVASSGTTLSRNLQPGEYIVEVQKGAGTLATFDIELIPPQTSF